MPSSTKAASGCSQLTAASSCFLDLDRRNGDGTLRLFPRKVETNHRNVIILAVILGIFGSIALLLLIYYVGRRYLSRQDNPSSTDMIIEKPIDISSPIQTTYPPTPTSPYKDASSPSNSPGITETAAPFTINHPYGHPYVTRDTMNVSMPPSTLGTVESTADSSSIRSMLHPYSSQQQRRTIHHVKKRDHQSQQGYTNNNNNNSNNSNNSNTGINDVQARTATNQTVDEGGRQRYESFMSPDTPHLSIKDFGSSLEFPNSITAEQQDTNTSPATVTGTGSKTSLTTATAEKRGRSGTGQVTTTATTTTTASSNKTHKLAYPPSVHTYDTVHSEDTLPSMYSYTSTSGPVPIQELHFPQPQPHHSIIQSRSQFKQ